MRIISGFLSSRTFLAPSGHRTHPMGDKPRGALFNMLGDITGLTVLDAFAGSGALGFEAISQGAASALLIESDRNAQNTIAQNITNFGIANQAKLIRANVSSWSDNNLDQLFDVVLCDPPYDSLNLNQLEKLLRHVKSSGMLVLSWPTPVDLPEFSGFKLLKNRTYAQAQLAFYRRIT